MFSFFSLLPYVLRCRPYSENIRNGCGGQLAKEAVLVGIPLFIFLQKAFFRFVYTSWIIKNLYLREHLFYAPIDWLDGYVCAYVMCMWIYGIMRASERATGQPNQRSGRRSAENDSGIISPSDTHTRTYAYITLSRSSFCATHYCTIISSTLLSGSRSSQSN